MAKRRSKRKVKRTVVEGPVTYPNARPVEVRRTRTFPGDVINHVAPGRGFRRPVGRVREVTD